ncbi:unnamed protein product [Schistosoma margrebowiei]|uniref:Uncharacterized protein n=1 Tax=Schistosoma margrebowiei TaxID=48269 RepID=A0A183LLE7_9TREM|nr:unnamed protein product [Schistosoma margrebowiei]
MRYTQQQTRGKDIGGGLDAYCRKHQTVSQSKQELGILNSEGNEKESKDATSQEFEADIKIMNNTWRELERRAQDRVD